MRLKSTSYLIILGLILAFSSWSENAQAQKSRQDSIIIPHLDLVYSYRLPSGNLADRFGFFHTIGAAFYVKDRKGFIYGADYDFQFGDQVKENTLTNILTTTGHLINSDGEFATLKANFRGFTVSGKFGKLFPLLSPNPHSGIKVLLGVGFWQHRIRVEDTQRNTPQISGEYLKGYDRMSNGLLLSQFVGYQYFSNSRLLNFYFGVEVAEGFTQNRRDYDFNTKEKNTDSRFDASVGFKVGWVIPFYKKRVQKRYYN
ncbi:hypothetical protein KFE98_10075 [bacterium SCSIO 12741]|nr:hypothetical protein KFE98_10075 [bacterium SCSIO 12741]